MTEENDEMHKIVDDFVVETRELIESVDSDLIKLESDPSNLEIINKLFRGVHTIKGAAGFLGFTKIVDVVHNAEAILNKCRLELLVFTSSINEVLLNAMDVIKSFLDNIASREKLTADIKPIILALKNCLEDYQAGLTEDVKPNGGEVQKEEAVALSKPVAELVVEEITGDAVGLLPTSGELVVEEIKLTDVQLKAELGLTPDPQKSEPEVTENAELEPEVTPKTKKSNETKAANSQGGTEQTIRVDVERLDSMMNLVGELVLGRNRVVQIGSKLEDSYKDDGDVQNLVETMAHISTITTDLQHAVMKTRMLPVKKVFSRFPRMVRDIAKLLGKEISLRLEGEDTELDKSVIEEIGDPLVHLVRNSIDHGIEMPDVRRAAGKPIEGEIVLSAFHDGNSIVIKVSDDGGGIDTEAIASRALKKGIIKESEIEHMSEREKLNLLFAPGLSTAEVTTDISGRGVGMDVVRNNVVKLNGTISIATELGKGTVFSVKLPLTVAIIQTLRVGVGEESFALPLVSVLETVRISTDTIQHIDAREVIYLRNEVLPLVRLANLFDVETGPEVPDVLGKVWSYIVVIEIAEKKIALMVEKLFGQEEVVIKSLGEHLRPKGIAGATILGDGTVILIVDIGVLMEMIESDSYTPNKIPKRGDRLTGREKNKGRKILIVDDSSPSRKIQKKVLESGGFTVLEAMNGREGFEILSKHPEIDLIVTDLAMQGMDGVEMTKRIKSEPRFKAIPIIALTTMEESENKNAGLQAGIDEFFSKTDIAGILSSIRRHFN